MGFVTRLRRANVSAWPALFAFLSIVHYNLVRPQRAALITSLITFAKRAHSNADIRHKKADLMSAVLY